MSWTAGIHAVETTLRDAPDEVAEVWFVRSDNPGAARRRIREQVDELNLRVRMVSDDQMRRAVGQRTNHQGVAARVESFTYATEDSVLETAGESALIVALDGVQDPHNLGAVLRSACAMGAHAVVIPQHRAASVTTAVRKVSAGATERIPVAQVTNVAKFLDAAKEAGFWTYGTIVAGGDPVHRTSFAERTVLVLGSEANGIRKGVEKRLDAKVTLPMDGLESLNVSVAAGIFVYEWWRQHRAG